MCREKGITGGKMCTDIGLSKSLMTGLKKGRRSSISTETAQKIAEYFGVSVDRVLGSDQKEKSPAPEGAEDSEISLDEMKVLLRRLGLIGEGDDITEKDAAFVSGVFDLLEAWFSR